MDAPSPDIRSSSSDVPRIVSKVTDSIYLSGKPHTEDALLLHSRGIRAVLEITEEMDNHSEAMKRNFSYMHVPAEDTEQMDILSVLDSAVDFIHQNVREGTPVLVHCHMGISRSATVVIAYLIKYYGMHPTEAFNYLRNKRAVINPNPGFVLALYRYAANQG